MELNATETVTAYKGSNGIESNARRCRVTVFTLRIKPLLYLLYAFLILDTFSKK